MKAELRTLAMTVAAMLVAACSSGPAETGAPDVTTSQTRLTQAEEQGVLALVNDCAVSLSALDVDASLDARAARNILAHRDGTDGVCGTADDDPFGDIGELDAVSYVGDSAIQKLLAYARAQGYVNEGSAGTIAGYFEGVPFTAAEITSVLALANTASLQVLDDDVGLDSRAANGIVSRRPFADADPLVNMQSLADVPYVGAAALEQLKAYAAASPTASCPALGGTFEGVTFTDRQAADVLDLVNRGGDADLRAITGIGETLAGRITAARPFTSISAVGAVSGVGATVLGNLRDEVATTWCATATAQCGCTSGGSSEPAGTQTHDGVTFTAAEAAAALDVVNQATKLQLRADGPFTEATTDTFLGGRPWADLAAVAAASGIGPATMEALRSFAASDRWQGPGPMRTAITVAQLLANPGAYVGQFVSFNRLVVRSTVWSTIFAAEIADDATVSASVQMQQYLCNPMTESCVNPPPLAGGETVAVAHVRVEDGYDGLWLRINDTSVLDVTGCSEGWSRSCGKDVGVCSPGTETCSSNRWSECTGMVQKLDYDPCDGVDNDCDGIVDENGTSLSAVARLADPIIAVGPRGADSLAATDTEYLRLDLSNPASPRVLERRARPEAGRGLITIRTFPNGTALADCRYGLSLYPTPASGLVAAQTLIPSPTTFCLEDVDRASNLLVTADWYNGVYAYDLSGGTPVEKFRLAVSYPRAARIRNGYLLVLTSSSFQVYDIRAAAPVLVKSFALPYSSAMAVSDAGLVAVAADGIRFFDVGDPAAPVALPTFGGITTRSLSFSGSQLAAISSLGDRTLNIIDVTNPTAPRIVAQTQVPDPTGATTGTALRTVELSGDLVYVGANSGLHVYRLGAGCGL